MKQKEAMKIRVGRFTPFFKTIPSCGLAVLFAMAVSVVASSPKTVGVPVGRLPNIILIMADDLGYGDLGCYGNREIKTPHIDALARIGIRFTDFHANGPVCSPTRAALLTGRYQQRSGFAGFPHEFPEKPYRPADGLAPSETTFAEALKPAGYATAVFGKWHMGVPVEFNPVRQGFDGFRGFTTGNIDYFSHVSQQGQEDWWKDDRKVPEEGYATDLLTRHSLAFIEKNKDRPFCLYLAHACAHYPWQAPADGARYRRQAKKVPGPGNVPNALGDRLGTDAQRAIQTMIERMDDGIGQIVSSLKANGLAEHTFVFFCSDNGAWPSRGAGSNGPLAGIKGDLFEGGHRVPAIACWPGKIKPGVSDQTLMSMDLFPTLLSLAQLPVPDGLELDGLDLTPMLLENKRLPPRTLFWGFSAQRAVRSGPWKLVKGVRQNPNKILRAISGDFLSLYNLDSDLGEEVDLAASHPEKVKLLLQELAAWERDVRHSPAAHK